MSKILVIIILSLITILLIHLNARQSERLIKKIISSNPFISSSNQDEFNPDINTNNWHIHKKRLEKFRRSQYKGLTFFVSPEDRIYYISEKGTKVYC